MSSGPSRGFTLLDPVTAAVVAGVAPDLCPYCAVWPDLPCAHHRDRSGADA